MDAALFKILANVGANVVVIAIVALCLVKIINKHAPPFIEAQQKQAASLSEVATVIRDYMGRDNIEHRELLLMQKALITEIQLLQAKIGGCEK